MKYLLISILFFSSSCATVHKSRFAKQVDKSGVVKVEKKEKKNVPFNPYESKGSSYMRRAKESKTESGLVVSYEWSYLIESKHFRYLDFSFENMDTKWKKVEKIGLRFGKGTASDDIFFLKGAPLAAYLKGKSLQYRVNLQNQAVAASVLAGVAAGAAASASSSDYSNYNTGFVTAATASALVSANSKKQERNYPEEHLFGSKDRFLLPPGLTINKYVVFFSEKPESFDTMNTLYLTYYLKGGEKEVLKLDVTPSRYRKKKRY